MVNPVSPAFIMTSLVEGMMGEMAEEQDEDLETAIEDFFEHAGPTSRRDGPSWTPCRVLHTDPGERLLCVADSRRDGGRTSTV